MEAQYSREKYLLLKKLNECVIAGRHADIGYFSNPKQLSLSKLLSNSLGVIAGGAVSSVFSGLPIKDYDLYFKSAWHRDGFI